MSDAEDSAPPQIKVLGIDVVPYEHAIWCSVGDGKPFANTIELRGWSEDGKYIWFLLGTHNSYKAAPDELVQVVTGGDSALHRKVTSSLFGDTGQFDNEVFLRLRPIQADVADQALLNIIKQALPMTTRNESPSEARAALRMIEARLVAKAEPKCPHVFCSDCYDFETATKGGE